MRLLIAAIAFIILLPTSVAQADGSYCWCRTPGWICTNHRANEVSGGTAGDTFTDAQCNTYCASRSSGSRAIHVDTTYRDTAICPTDCLRGGSCPSAPSPENSCVCGGDRLIGASASVTDVGSCCAACASGGTNPSSVGYGGSTVSCPATPGSSTVGTPTVSSTGPIRLYNPLGAETDIPAFIGRGIRGVLGVIGAIALLMFVYGGVTWMTAGGDSKKVDGAKSIIKNSVIGLLLIFFSYNLIGIFFDFFR